MPVHSQQQGTTPAPPTTSTSTSTTTDGQNQLGNDAVQQQLQAVSPGRLSWTGALGETLGGKLYDAMAPQLTDDKLLGHANSIVAAAIEALRGEVNGSVTPTDQEAAALFVTHLDAAMRTAARQAVVASGLSQGIRDFADAHPFEVALAAVAGAVAFVLSNQDIPLLSTKLGLGGGHGLVVGIDPGRTLALTVEQVRVGYTFSGDNLAAQLTADVYPDGHAVAGNVSVNPTEDSSVDLSGSHTDRAGTQLSRVDLRYNRPELSAGLGWQNQVGGPTPGQSLTGSISQRGAPGSVLGQASGLWHESGAWNAGLGVGQTQGNASWSVEGYTGQTSAGTMDTGVRAMFRLRF